MRKSSHDRTLKGMHKNGSFMPGMRFCLKTESFCGLNAALGSATTVNLRNIQFAPPTKKLFESCEDWEARNLKALQRTEFEVVRVNEKSLVLSHKAYSGTSRKNAVTSIRTHWLTDKNPVEVVLV